MMECPNCGNAGAVKSLLRVRCPNQACVHFDANLAARPVAAPAPRAATVDAGERPPRRSPQIGLAATLSAITTLLCLGVYYIAVDSFGDFHSDPLGARLARGGWKILVGMWAVLIPVFVVMLRRDGERVARWNAQRRKKQEALQSARSFEPTGDRKLVIRFTNWKQESREFVADREGAYWTDRFLVIRVAPEGVRITLDSQRIHNLPEVKAAVG